MRQTKQITTLQAGKAQESNIKIILSLLSLFIGILLLTQQVGAMNLVEQVEQAGSQKPITLAVIEQPELVARVLESLLRNILDSANIVDFQTNQNAQKRGLDLGISRGFSGSQAGKHLMGLSAASFANGPGR